MKVAGEIETYSPRVCQCGHLEKDHDLYDAVSRKRMDCLVGVFKGMEIDAKPCPCSNFSLVHVGQHHRDNPNERLEMDAGAGHSDYPSELIFTSDRFVVTAFGYDREHCEDVLQCVLHGRFGDHEGDREWREV